MPLLKQDMVIQFLSLAALEAISRNIPASSGHGSLLKAVSGEERDRLLIQY